jgi:hypothetical protein
LENSRYRFTAYRFTEKPELKTQLAPAFANATVSLDSISTPIISLGGVLHVTIENFEQLIQAMDH